MVTVARQGDVPREWPRLRVGLTGGIGSGKSTVSAGLADHGAIVIDYDLLAREAVEPGTSALHQIIERFGHGVLRADGSLDRPALGSIVFGDDPARRELEEITHPAIIELALDREHAAGSQAIVVHDNPLLVDMGMHRRCDVVLVVDIPEDIQVARLTEQRGMSEAAARSRIAAQLPRKQRADAADIIIDNTGSLDELATKVGGVWARLAAIDPPEPAGQNFV